MTDTNPKDVSRVRAWVIAARPHTFPAGVAPVVVGTGLALHDGVFDPLAALVALVSALLIQIGANFANDYYDAVKGADTDESEGYTRVTQQGLIPPETVKRGTALTFGLAFVVGLYLVKVGGAVILAVGVLSIISGIIYTGGPYPIGYHGLGDLFVFVFFGVVGVTGTYYVQAASAVGVALSTVVPPPGTLTSEAVVASLGVAGFETGILVVNNIRDLETDAQAGKKTLAVLIGYTASRFEYGLLVALSYAVPLYLFTRPDFGAFVLLPFLTVPYAISLLTTVATESNEDGLNPALEGTGKLLAVYSALFAAGMVVS
ncbi:MAG: 1,4-dihydroxy-2-naphthoate polyprenyltransferase [Halobacteria archaeon]|nr:1,4-dihydroxy-2-naphthoate polyprenyltransferase [Halobacteria archaeon]